MRKVLGAAVLALFLFASPAFAADPSDSIQVDPIPLDPLTAAFAMTANDVLRLLRSVLPGLVAVCVGLGSLLLWLGPRLGNPQWRWTGYLLCVGSITLYSFVALLPLGIYFMTRAGMMGNTIP